MKNAHDHIIIKFAENRGNSLSACINKQMPWGEFRSRMEKPLYSTEDHDTFNSKELPQQTAAKGAAGWMVAGELDGPDRKNNNVMSRSLISIDCDDMSPELFETIRTGKNPVCKYELFAHTTRQHTPQMPRLRIFLPMTRHIQPDHYPAVARMIAHLIDNTMQAIDPISFRIGQLMFNPTCSKGNEFLHWHNHGELIDPSVILRSWIEDGQNLSKLPHNESRGLPRTSEDVAEDPRTKKFLLGAFCRAYPIEKAIAKFISEIYKKSTTYSTKPRYTYTKGTTADGVVVEDGGLFIYSYHGTDPCAERLVNAFDMVRIHLFGHLDKDSPKGGSPHKKPSFQAMQSLIQEDPLVKKQMVAKSVDLVAINKDAADNASIANNPLFAGLDGPTAPAANKNPDWAETLELDTRGNFKPSMTNIMTILMNDPRLAGVIGFNEFTNRIVFRDDLKTSMPIISNIYVEDRKNGDDLDDRKLLTIKALLDAPAGKGKLGWGISCNSGSIEESIKMVADNTKFHPVKEYLEGLIWDQKPRVDTLWVDYLGTPNTAYYRETAALLIMAACCRVFNRGCKWDHVPVLQGDEGLKKSWFIATLATNGWSSELTAPLNSNKDAVEQMMGNWFLEIPEMANYEATKEKEVKAFITTTTDVVRLTYAKFIGRYPRGCVKVGTSNPAEYLKGNNGNRRWWPIKVLVDVIDMALLEANIDQIWAEGFYRWNLEKQKFGDHKKIPLELSDIAQAEAKQLQNEAQVECGDVANGEAIREWLDTPLSLSEFTGDTKMKREDDHLILRCATTPREAGTEVFDISAHKYLAHKGIETSVGGAMVNVKGWEKNGRLRLKNYGNGNRYIRIGATKEDIDRRYQIVKFGTERILDGEFNEE